MKLGIYVDNYNTNKMSLGFYKKIIILVGNHGNVKISGENGKKFPGDKLSGICKNPNDILFVIE